MQPVGSMRTAGVELPIMLEDTRGPVSLRGTLDDVPRGRRLPFHVIVSEGLLGAWQSLGWANARRELGPEVAWWRALAPLVEDVWNRCAEREAMDVSEPYRAAVALMPRCRQAPALPSEALVRDMLQAARDAGVRSFSQGLEAARDYVLGDGGTRLARILGAAVARPIELEEVRSVRLVAVREGHTSGVVHLRAGLAGGTSVDVGLNVARDRTGAARALAAMTEDLRTWHAMAPGRVAAVLDQDVGRIRWFGQTRTVPITAVSWIPGDELHVIRADDGAARFQAVRGFVHGAHAVPAIRGVLLDAARSRDIGRQLVALETRLAAYGDDGTVTASAIELNHGDAVLVGAGDAAKVALVGSAGRSWRGPLAAWPYRMAALSARDELQATRARIYWDEPAAAIESMTAAMLADPRLRVRDLAVHALRQASHARPAMLRAALADVAVGEDGWNVIERARAALLRSLRAAA